MRPSIQGLFDLTIWTVSYVVFDEPGGSCAIIDPCSIMTESGQSENHF